MHRLRALVLLGWAFMVFAEGGSMAPSVTTISPTYKDKATCDELAEWRRKLNKDQVSRCAETDTPPCELAREPGQNSLVSRRE